MFKKARIKSVASVSEDIIKKISSESKDREYVLYVWKEIVGRKIYENTRITLINEKRMDVEVYENELKMTLYMQKKHIEEELHKAGINKKIFIKYKGG